MEITLEGKQSAKAEKLVDYLYEDNKNLYELAHNFQDEQRYTLCLLSDILNKIDFSTLATLGFREHYLKSLAILFKDDITDEEYVNRLLEEDDLPAIFIAHKILESQNKNEYVKILEERINI